MFTVFGVPTPTPSSGSSDKASPPPQPRQKRAQVSRACDWCRLTRVKCDTVRPCRNCKDAKRECVNAGRDDFKSVAAATKEVQRLRAQVRELEAKLLSPTSLNEESPRNRKRRVRWKGVTSPEGYSVQYGPSSLPYFVHRLSKFTKMDIRLESPPINTNDCPLEDMPDTRRLQRQQQDVFLDLFWQGYHAIYPILDEASFRRHYDSLWENEANRRPCPLVDSALALCIQFGSTYMSCTGPNGDLPGRDYYMRAQFHMSHRTGPPTLMLAQCYFLSVLYLLATDQYDAAYAMIGTAIRVAQSLGIHHDNDDTTTSYDIGVAECRKRLWNCLIMLDTQISICLGRPFAIRDTSSEDSKPDSDEQAAILGPTYTLSSDLKINWLRFQYERRRLFDLVREIHDEFYTVCETVLEEIDASDFYPYPSSREKCAQFLFQKLKKLKEWAEELPEALKTARINGIPFSTDRSALDLSNNEPLWLQRQRLILELEYHTFAVVLRRPFISFLPTPALGTLSSDNHCIVAGNSSLAITNILHQVLRDTDILTGWHQVPDWQLNALLLLAGFTYGYPICPISPSLRRTISTAAVVFETIKETDKAAMAIRLRDKSFERLKDFGQRIGLTDVVPTSPDVGAGRTVPGTHTGLPSPVNPDLATMDLGQGDKNGDSPFGVDTENLWATSYSSGAGTLLWGDLMRDFGTGMAMDLGVSASLDVTETI